MADKEIKVTLEQSGTTYTIDTKPYKAKTNKTEGSSVSLQWQAKGSGVSFPSSNYFDWLSGPTPFPPMPTRTSPTQLDVTYTVPPSTSGTVLWRYKICLTHGSVTVCEDPEAENQVPPTDGGEEHGNKPPKDKPNKP